MQLIFFYNFHKSVQMALGRNRFNSLSHRYQSTVPWYSTDCGEGTPSRSAPTQSDDRSHTKLQVVQQTRRGSVPLSTGLHQNGKYLETCSCRAPPLSTDFMEIQNKWERFAHYLAWEWKLQNKWERSAHYLAWGRMNEI